MGKSQEGEEEELTVPEALVKDKRKCKIQLLDLYVRLTGALFFVILCFYVLK